MCRVFRPATDYSPALVQSSFKIANQAAENLVITLSAVTVTDAPECGSLQITAEQPVDLPYSLQDMSLTFDQGPYPTGQYGVTVRVKLSADTSDAYQFVIPIEVVDCETMVQTIASPVLAGCPIAATFPTFSH